MQLSLQLKIVSSYFKGYEKSLKQMLTEKKNRMHNNFQRKTDYENFSLTSFNEYKENISLEELCLYLSKVMY